MKQNQSGSVLAISLVLLTTITLIAMMSLQRSGLQTKIVANILHKEAVFNASLNEQEFWFSQYANNPTQHVMDVIDNRDDDNNPVPLNLDPSRSQGPGFPLQVNSRAVYVLPESDDITLAIGEEAGARQVYNFELDSSANYELKPNLLSAQQSAFSFPGLSISQNSL